MEKKYVLQVDHHGWWSLDGESVHKFAIPDGIREIGESQVQSIWQITAEEAVVILKENSVRHRLNAECLEEEVGEKSREIENLNARLNDLFKAAVHNLLVMS